MVKEDQLRKEKVKVFLGGGSHSHLALAFQWIKTP